MTYEELKEKLEEKDLDITEVYYAGRLADDNTRQRVLVNTHEEYDYAYELCEEYNDDDDLCEQDCIEVLWEGEETEYCEKCGHYWYKDDYSRDGEWGEYGWYCPDCLEDEDLCEDIIENKYIDNPKTALNGDLLDNYDLEKHGWHKGERSYSNGWYGYNDNIPPKEVMEKELKKWDYHAHVVFVVKGSNMFETNWTYYYKVDEDYLERLLDEIYPDTHSA